MSKRALIIGAGPAGLTAAYELVTRTDIKPVIIEKTGDIGGISKTVLFKGNRIDLGGHRFFSKSDLIMKWLLEILPLQGSDSKDEILKKINYHNKSLSVSLSPGGPDPEKTDRVMLIRNRLSRIFFLRRFFDFPITINRKTIINLGFIRIIKISWTYFFGFIALIILIIRRKQILWLPYQRECFLLLLAFIAVYFAFSVCAGPFELRYIAPVHQVQLSLIFIIVNNAGVTFKKSTSLKDSDS